MTYQELLDKIPEMEEEIDDEGDDLCPVCLAHGFCRTRADALVDDVLAVLASDHGLIADPLSVLRWLLDTDAIGIDKDENHANLARQYAGVAAEGTGHAT